MEITPEISRKNLRIWQCALVNWKDPLAWGRGNGACNTMYSGEKTYVEWGCKGIVSDVVQMWGSSVRDSFSLPNRWPAEPIPVFGAMLSMPSHILWFALCASMDRKHSQHLIFSPLCPSLPTSPKGKEAERGQRMLLFSIAWERICGWLLCEKGNKEMTACTLPHPCRWNESLVNCSEVFNIKLSFSLLGYMQNDKDKLLSLQINVCTSIKLSAVHSLTLPVLSTIVLSHLPCDYRKSQKGSK